MSEETLAPDGQPPQPVEKTLVAELLELSKVPSNSDGFDNLREGVGILFAEIERNDREEVPEVVNIDLMIAEITERPSALGCFIS